MQKCYIKFSSDITNIALPKKFTFPFYYEPHKLTKIAVSELQKKLENTNLWQHNFGLDPDNQKDAIGKMFGVLIVKNKQNEIGYLTAYSGKLEGENEAVNFVPPIFDTYAKNGFFEKEEHYISEISKKIHILENSTTLQELKTKNQKLEIEKTNDLTAEKQKLNARKSDRKLKRFTIVDKNELEALNQQSIQDKFYYKELVANWKTKQEKITKKIEQLEQEINHLKQERTKRSEKLHDYIFGNYTFLNANQKTKKLLEIFNEINKKPIAGTGDCAAPKLLQYAFQNHLQPIAMAEFWWGKPLKNEIRKHKNFYPACNGKCKPILNHMLKGLEVDENPILINLAKDKKIETIYEDDYLLVINKPAELLTIPGQKIKDSVLTRIQNKYPNLSGPFIVHRLDMSTSGILLISKTKRVHKKLQSQFIKRTIKKQYFAILDGVLNEKNGIIDLPLTTDYHDTPKQKVCFKSGKPAKTKYQVVEVKNNQTKVYFYPITGRTHQLRVHAAHYLGLNTPIVGDDLYGTKINRLHLHAYSITFEHPISKKKMQFTSEINF